MLLTNICGRWIHRWPWHNIQLPHLCRIKGKSQTKKKRKRKPVLINTFVSKHNAGSFLQYKKGGSGLASVWTRPSCMVYLLRTSPNGVPFGFNTGPSCTDKGQEGRGSTPTGLFTRPKGQVHSLQRNLEQDWLAGCMAGRSAGRPTDWLTDWLAGHCCLSGPYVAWGNSWFFNRATDQQWN